MSGSRWVRAARVLAAVGAVTLGAGCGSSSGHPRVIADPGTTPPGGDPLTVETTPEFPTPAT